MNMRVRRGDHNDSDAHTHRRLTDGDAIVKLHARIDDHADKISSILEAQRRLTDNMATLNTNMGRVADALEAYSNLKGFWLTLTFFGTVVKVIGPILIFVGALWFFLRTGVWGKQ